MIQSYKDLRVYQVSYALAMEVFWLTKKFPKDELYSLTDQLRRASRSVAVNIVEGGQSGTTKMSSNGTCLTPSAPATKPKCGWISHSAASILRRRSIKAW